MTGKIVNSGSYFFYFFISIHLHSIYFYTRTGPSGNHGLKYNKMVHIDCSSCKGLCCTSKTRAVLTPQEVGQFKDFSTKITTKDGDIYVLKQNNKGHCIFYDPEKNGCKTYETRPFECRTYPYVVFYDKKVGFQLDSRFCPNIHTCTIDNVKEEKTKWNNQKLPLEWVKAYTDLDQLV